MGIEEFIALMKVKQGDKSLRQFALSLGVSVAYLSDIYLRRRMPGAKIARALGYSRQKTQIITIVFTKLKSNIGQKS